MLITSFGGAVKDIRLRAGGVGSWGKDLLSQGKCSLQKLIGHTEIGKDVAVQSTGWYFDGINRDLHVGGTRYPKICTGVVHECPAAWNL